MCGIKVWHQKTAKKTVFAIYKRQKIVKEEIIWNMYSASGKKATDRKSR